MFYFKGTSDIILVLLAAAIPKHDRTLVETKELA
jgi:hypothetical protein